MREISADHDTCVVCDADKPAFGDMRWGGKLPGSATVGHTACKSLHFTDAEPLDSEPASEGLQLNNFRALFMYIMLGGWYKGFGTAGDDATRFAESLFVMTGNLFDIFGEDEQGSVSLALCHAICVYVCVRHCL